MKKEEKVQTAQEQVASDTPSVVVQIPRTSKKYHIVSPLSNAQLEELARLLFRNDNMGDGAETAMAEILQDTKLACKAAAIYVTRGFWKLKMLYWLRWRWFYYIKQYDNAQLQPILSAGNGSTPYVDFLKMMSVLGNQKSTQMRMTAREAEKVLQELATREPKDEKGT